MMVDVLIVIFGGIVVGSKQKEDEYKLIKKSVDILFVIIINDSVFYIYSI